LRGFDDEHTKMLNILAEKIKRLTAIIHHIENR